MGESCTIKIIMYNNIASTGCLFHAADHPFHDDRLRSGAFPGVSRYVSLSDRMHVTGVYCCLQVLNNRLIGLRFRHGRYELLTGQLKNGGESLLSGGATGDHNSEGMMILLRKAHTFHPEAPGTAVFLFLH